MNLDLYLRHRRLLREKANKQKREFYIPRMGREQSLYGTEFEVKLRNEMTQKAIAKECADWIRRKASFRSNKTGENMPGFMTVDNREEKVEYAARMGSLQWISDVTAAIMRTTWSTGWSLRLQNSTCRSSIQFGTIKRSCRMSRRW